jgi:hypothetical protein
MAADYREGRGGGYGNQSGIRYDRQLGLDKTLKIYLVTGHGTPVKVAFAKSIWCIKYLTPYSF